MTASGKKKQLRRDAVTAGDSYKDPAHDFLLPTVSIPIEWVLHLGSFFPREACAETRPSVPT